MARTKILSHAASLGGVTKRAKSAGPSDAPRPHARAWLHLITAPLAILVFGLLACRGPKPSGSNDANGIPPEPAAQPRHELDVFAMGRALGTIAPCGCTTEPLGGLQYLFGALNQRSHDGAFVVAGSGSFLYPDPAGPEAPKDDAAWAQAEQRATVLTRQFDGIAPNLALGLGPTDLASPHGVTALQMHPLPRVLANAPLPMPREATSSNSTIEPDPMRDVLTHRVLPLRAHTFETKIGITSVVDPQLLGHERLGTLTQPEPAAKAASKAMRDEGAQLTILVVEGPRALAESLAGALDFDIVVVGYVTGISQQRTGLAPSRIGNTWIFEPGEQLQTVTNLHVSLASDLVALPPVREWTFVSSPSSRAAEVAQLEERLTAFERQDGADPAYLARLRSELQRARAAANEPPPVDAKVVAYVDQVKITCKGPADVPAQTKLREYDTWVANENKARFAGVKPPPPKRGEAGYVGMETCEMCHEEAATYWQDTRHAQAFETLVRDNKQFDLSCVGCHVTGFREPGGSEVVENEHLRAIQCEVCHGPGSLHADKPTIGDKPHAIVLDPGESKCLSCHTPDHSDTFDYTAYMRDILGAGHGAEARKQLGDGPTGRELRAAGLAKAGGACKKM